MGNATGWLGLLQAWPMAAGLAVPWEAPPHQLRQAVSKTRLYTSEAGTKAGPARSI